MRAKWPNQVGWVFASNVRVWPFAWNRWERGSASTSAGSTSTMYEHNYRHYEHLNVINIQSPSNRHVHILGKHTHEIFITVIFSMNKCFVTYACCLTKVHDTARLLFRKHGPEIVSGTGTKGKEKLRKWTYFIGFTSLWFLLAARVDLGWLPHPVVGQMLISNSIWVIWFIIWLWHPHETCR